MPRAMATLVTLLGFGEAGMCFGEAWRAREGVAARAYDLLTDDPATAAAKQADYARLGVDGRASAADAVAGVPMIISVVTADQALAAAEAAGPGLAPGALYCDFNSVAPATKQEAARLVERGGGRYVDVAVMAPVRPAALDVPLLVSGPHAQAATAALSLAGFSPRAAGARIGDAAAIKMLRSIMVKGIEALTAECFLAAGAAGLAEEVAASLAESGHGRDWLARADYNIERMMSHGLRRAAEMDQVVEMLENWDRPSIMARAAAEAQRSIGRRRIPAPPGVAAKAAALSARSSEAA